MFSDEVKPGKDQLSQMKQQLLEELRKLTSPITVSNFNEEEGIA